MSFVHEDAAFEQLLEIVARETGIAAALVEKDYWVTHVLWALHQTKLAIWFKGGTSLSKGFGLIQRSEDLDLMVLHGSAAGLPDVTSWTSSNKGPVEQRRSFYEALAGAFVVPGVRVEQDRSRLDKQARAADYLGHYPGVLLDQLSPVMSPFVRIEVGRARVVPHVEKPLSSFVHDYLEDRRLLGDHDDNRPQAVRCVHPLVTLFEKLDAISRRFNRDAMEPDAFVRHYEDAARIIRATNGLPEMGMTVNALASDMLRKKDVTALPSPDDPALLLAEPDKRAAVGRAYAAIAPMFWGPRVALDAACSDIRAWLEQLRTSR